MLHRNLLHRLSKPLDTLVNGHMKEAQDGTATLKDVNAATFSRFVDFAYSFASLDTNLLESKDDKKVSLYGDAVPICPECSPEEPDKELDILCSTYGHILPNEEYMWQVMMRRPDVGKDDSIYSRAVHYVQDREEKKHVSGLKRTLASSAKLYIFADKYLIKSQTSRTALFTKGLEKIVRSRYRLDPGQ